jgi:16S rRNA processing protein RimM
MLLLCLEGVEDRDAAKALCGSRLLTADSALPPLEEDEVYVRDLLGADVMLPDGSRLGRLDHLLAESGQDVWVIVTDGGEEILFPARPCFIERFDLERGRVHVAPPEGLLDVYLR